MTDLDKLRDELADAHASKDGLTDPAKFYSYCAGWNACDKVLTETAGEFDSVAAKRADEAYWNGAEDSATQMEQAYLTGRKEQFEADRARIGLAEFRLESVKHFFDDAQKHCWELIEKNTQLESRLAESERSWAAAITLREGALQDKVEKLERELAAFVRDNKRLETKLTAVELELKGYK